MSVVTTNNIYTVNVVEVRGKAYLAVHCVEYTKSAVWIPLNQTAKL